MDEKPIKGLALKKKIPLKPKELPVHETDAHTEDDGLASVAGGEVPGSQGRRPAKRQRPDDLEELSAPKKAKVTGIELDDDLVVIDDNATNGAIVIDD